MWLHAAITHTNRLRQVFTLPQWQSGICLFMQRDHTHIYVPRISVLFFLHLFQIRLKLHAEKKKKANVLQNPHCSCWEGSYKKWSDQRKLFKAVQWIARVYCRWSVSPHFVFKIRKYLYIFYICWYNIFSSQILLLVFVLPSFWSLKGVTSNKRKY